MSELLPEHAVVVPTRDLPDEGLRAGDVAACCWRTRAVTASSIAGRDGRPTEEDGEGGAVG